MAQSDVEDIKDDISNVFDKHVSGAPSPTKSMFPASNIGGKLYEAHVLSQVCKELATKESFTLRLSHGNLVKLKSSPSPINKTYPHIELKRGTGSGVVAEMWTDVEFIGLSYNRQKHGPSSQANRSHYHELDILVTDKNLPDGSRPQHSEIWMGVECKYRNFSKGFLKEIFGVRRQMSYIDSTHYNTKFQNWPDDTVTERPASCLLLYCRDSKINKYTEAPKQFDIHMVHSALP